MVRLKCGARLNTVEEEDDVTQINMENIESGSLMVEGINISDEFSLGGRIQDAQIYIHTSDIPKIIKMLQGVIANG